MLKIALPNKGSLSKGAIELMSAAGYKCRRISKELICIDKENNIEFIFLRPKDIAIYVDANVFHLGITGRDILMDSNFKLEETLALDFAKASMHYIIPQKQNFVGQQQLNNKRIACSYSNLLRKHLDRYNIKADIIKLEGAVEISIHLGIADAIVDVVETGTTIKEAGLKIVGEAIIDSEAILVNKLALADLPKEAKIMILRLRGIIAARNYVMIEYDIVEKNLKKACQICQGIQSPTVTTLYNDGWLSVKVMAKLSTSNFIMDQLYNIGAKGIIVTKINNFRI